jgi:hypothetical protein
VTLEPTHELFLLQSLPLPVHRGQRTGPDLGVLCTNPGRFGQKAKEEGPA